jgi:carboxyl-terminal processing protease
MQPRPALIDPPARWRMAPQGRFLLAAVTLALALALPSRARAEETPRAQLCEQGAGVTQDWRALFDAVVETTAKSFWDKDQLAKVGWDKRAADLRQGVVEAPSLKEAARRINALLGELKTSHTALLTPDDVDYYVLMAVFGGASMPQKEFDARFWGAGVTFAGIGHFSVRIDGRDFVDAVLEVSVDGAPYHPIRSFQGKVGHEAVVAIRRVNGGPAETLRIKVMSIAPLHAFREATRASARLIERDGRRIGYVHVWASVGEESTSALSDAISGLGINAPPHRNRDKTEGGGQAVRVDGLIIDMRGKIGGNGSTAARYLEVLDPRGPLFGSRNKANASRFVTTIRGRTAVLIDHHTRSTAELFVHAYKRERQGPLVGTRTAGAVSAASAFAMPGGNLLYLAVSGLEVDGEVLEGPGVAPDVEVARPIPFAGGADPVLDAGVEALVAKAKAREAVETDRKAAIQ